MVKQNAIKVFEEKKVRTVWDSDKEEWYFSIVDVVAVLTDSPNPRNYWKVLKHRLVKEGNESVTNCNQLKMPSSDGKYYKTDVAKTEQLLRFIQLRKDLTDEWKRHGLQEGVQFATLTDIIYKTWAGKIAKEYKQFKGLKKENLRDNMTNTELVLNMLAELSTKRISEVRNPESFEEHMNVAHQGGSVARNARMELEARIGEDVVTPLNAKDMLELQGDAGTKEGEEDVQE